MATNECPCDSCQSCDSCENCNGCYADCNSAQNFCRNPSNQVLSNKLGENFYWTKCVDQGQVMYPGEFDIKEWNRICSYINRRTEIGNAEHGALGGSSFSKNTSINKNNPYFTAAEFNRVAGEIELGYKVEPKWLIKGYYFSDLIPAVNTYKFYEYACDFCNTKCDGGCDNCNGCNAGAQKTVCHDITCCGCDSCDSCEGDDTPDDDDDDDS